MHSNYCHNPSLSPSPRLSFLSNQTSNLAQIFTVDSPDQNLLISGNQEPCPPQMNFLHRGLKLKIQFQNSIQDCDKVESNSSLFLKLV